MGQGAFIARADERRRAEQRAMSYADRELCCRDCGEPFVWTAGEQSYYAVRDLAPPKRCKPCRAARRVAADPTAPAPYAPR